MYVCVYQIPEFGKNKLERVKEGLGRKNPFVEASLMSGYVCCCCSEVTQRSLSLVTISWATSQKPDLPAWISSLTNCRSNVA